MPTKQVRHSSGLDFYDYGYDSDEDSIENRINFRKVKFSGRREELKLLHARYEDTREQGEKQSIVPLTLISGFSGTGKTALVKSFVDELKAKSKTGKGKEKCHSICVRFNQTDTKTLTQTKEQQAHSNADTDDPFSAIVEGLTIFSSEILQGEENQLAEIRENIKNVLGQKAISVLITAIPGLKGLINEAPQFDITSDVARSCLKDVLVVFVNAISTKKHPFVVFFDDLQWLDSISLDLITALLTDTSLRYVMFVGSCRCTEVDKEHPFSKSIPVIKKSRPISQIDLLNLSKNEIGKCIGSLLDLTVDEAIPLTDAVYSKSRGNTSLVIKALIDFEEKNALYFSMISFQWEWNLKDVDLGAGVSSDVIDVVASKFHQTPKKLQNALLVAAHTRTKIEIDTLQMLMQGTGFPVQLDELIRILDMAVLEGFITNVMGSNLYSFAHERIRQVALEFLPPGEERDILREKIGLVLLEVGSSNAGKDWMLFIAADHLNEMKLNDRDPMIMVRLNLEVGEKALKVAAFGNASDNLRKSRSALQRIKKHWENHYDISLRLYQSLADVELILGNYGIGNKLAYHVFDHVDDVKHALPTYLSLGRAMGRQGLHIDSLDLYWDALDQLDEGRKLSDLLWTLKTATRYFKMHSGEEILKLPTMDNDVKLAAMGFYNEAAHQTYCSGNYHDHVQITLRRLRITLKYGISKFASMTFAHFAGIVGIKDQDFALRMAKISHQVFKPKNQESKVLCCLTSLTEGWSNHYTETTKTLKYARRIGMDTGDIEFSLTSWGNVIQTGFMAGHPLENLSNESTKLLEKIRLYNVEGIIRIYEQQRIMIQYLSGREETSINWNKLDAFRDESDGSNEVYRLIYGYISRLALAVYFGEYALVGKWVDGLKKVAAHDCCFCTSISRIFYSGLALAGLSLVSKKTKYLAMAKKEAADMKKLIKARNLKNNHHYLIMEAQIMAASSSNFEKVTVAFAKAIHRSTETGHIHHAALCNELLGEFLYSKQKKDLAWKHFVDSRNLFCEWGAKGKVDHLGEKLSSSFGKNPTVSNSARNKVQFMATPSDESSDNIVPRFRISCTSLPHDLQALKELDDLYADDTNNSCYDTNTSCFSDPSQMERTSTS